MTPQANELILRTQKKLDDTSFDVPTLLDFLNDTEREVFNRYRINIQEQEDTNITTTPASRALTGLPGAVGTIVGQYINMRITLPVNYSMVIPYVDYEDADKFYPNYNLLGQGTPIAWFIFDGVPTLLNNADKIYTLAMKYTILPTAVTTTTSLTNIPENFSEITVLGMYARALEFNDEYDEAEAVRQQFTTLCVDYVDSTRREAGTPHTMRRPRNINAPFGLR